MKKVLSLILVMFFVVVASAQTRVFDTTIVKSPLGVTVTGGGVKDSLFIQAATTSQNGFMSSTSMQQLATLVAGSPTYPTPNSQSGSVYTVQTSDFNKMVIMTSNSSSTIILPTGLTPGWSCRVMQGNGTISLDVGGTYRPGDVFSFTYEFNFQNVTGTNFVVQLYGSTTFYFMTYKYAYEVYESYVSAIAQGQCGTSLQSNFVQVHALLHSNIINFEKGISVDLTAMQNTLDIINTNYSNLYV